MKKTKTGNHSTKFEGKGDEPASELRPYEFGDTLESIAVSESLRNAHINHGIDEFKLTPEDLEVQETFYQSQTSTVLMIDVSHSMILYGEDRMAPHQKSSFGLVGANHDPLPKGHVLIFWPSATMLGKSRWSLPYLEVGPFHTNTVAGLELAMDILKKRRNPNKRDRRHGERRTTVHKKGRGTATNCAQ